MKMMATYLMKLFLMLDTYIDDVNMMCKNNDEKGVLQGIRGFVKEKACMHVEKYVPSIV